MTDRLFALRAIEALRSGVPNRDAVISLGTTQPHIEEAFLEKLALAERGEAAGGLLIEGDFGTGKSHLLQFLQQRAVDRRFVTSRVVISKETPLHDVAKVLRSAIENSVVPERRGVAIHEITESLRFDTPEFDALYAWAGSPQSGLNERFPATLYLFQHMRGQNADMTETILRFWAGDTIRVGDLNRALTDFGQRGTWSFKSVPARELAVQRLRFLARLIRAAGYSGWAILFDEVELIGRYSLLQRGRAYAEIARWLRGFQKESLDYVTSVLALTTDFTSAVLDAKNDLDAVPNRLRARGKPEDDLAATRAEQGMRLLKNTNLQLERQTEHSIRATYLKLRELHRIAYGWAPPELQVQIREMTTPMRQYVRSWINEWDLRRLDPGYQPDIEVDIISSDYSEASELEAVEPEWENVED